MAKWHIEHLEDYTDTKLGTLQKMKKNETVGNYTSESAAKTAFALQTARNISAGYVRIHKCNHDEGKPCEIIESHIFGERKNKDEKDENKVGDNKK